MNIQLALRFKESVSSEIGMESPTVDEVDTCFENKLITDSTVAI